MAKAYFLNTLGMDLNLSVNNGNTQKLVALNIRDANPDMVLVCDLVQAGNPGPDKIGAQNKVQVIAPSDQVNINYLVEITVDQNTRPLTVDMQFIVFADGIVGRQGNQFDGITVKQATS